MGSGADILPVIVALHGGTYTSLYFDVPGFSLLRRADALGIPIIAIDRPGYGGTTTLSCKETSHAENAAVLDAALARIWEQWGGERAGIVLIGHSIGGAIALRIAGRRPGWPLLGVAVSGVGLRNSSSGADVRSRLPQTPYIDVPTSFKERQMFGPAQTFPAEAPEAIRLADAPAPRQELIDIASVWPCEVAALLGRIEVPVHYRQAEHDNMWTVTSGEVEAFAAYCSSARRVDAQMVQDAGHCMDFHWVGASFQLEQIAFALRCASDRRMMRGQPDAPASLLPT